MANQKATDGTRLVRLDLSIERRLILRHEIEVWRDGDRQDLETPGKLTDADWTRRQVVACERLSEALTLGRIELPDEEARAALQAAADDFDEAEAWEETRTIHDAQRALLAVLASGAAGETAPAESVVLQRVLDVHPARLTLGELIREVAGEAAEFGDRDAVERATRDLSDVGLLHRRDEFVTPTQAALRFQELLDR
jgi:hypothetical protein